MDTLFQAKQNQLLLQSLKQDCEQALSALRLLCNSTHSCSTVSSNMNSECQKSLNEEKIPILEATLEQIEKGLEDTEDLFMHVKHIEQLETELMTMRLHSRRLCEENRWLRETLKCAQSKLKESELLLAQSEAEKEQLKFMLDMKRYDDVSSNNFEIDRKGDPPIMMSSVLGLMSTSNHTNVSNQVDRPLMHNRLQKSSATSLSSFSTCNQLEMSGFMNSSLLDTDLDSLSDNRRDSNALPGMREHQNFQSGLKTIHHIVARYKSLGKYDVAASLCLQIIRNLEKSGGRDQAQIATLLAILAEVYREQGKYEDACDLLKQAVCIREKTLGPNHMLIASTLNNLAVLQAKLGQYAEAEPLCRRALSIRENLFGADHLGITNQLNNLALLCQNQGKFEEVASIYRRNLDIYSKHHKPSSLVMRKAKRDLASVLLKLDNVIEAESLLKAVLTPDQYNSSLQPKNQENSLSQSESVDQDSAIYSLSPLSNSDRGVYIEGVSPCNSTEPSILMNSSERRVEPLWVIVEQYVKDNDISQKFSLVKWASEAKIELSVVYSAVRNLANVYQRQGFYSCASLLREWLEMELPELTESASRSHHTSMV
uniref:Kinesin light chain n=1 Tax=Trichobilharzia regenti TaxID=157069 RepID=A0AA85JF34_TRIRE|nr:unnamed protein product [Trichobilharzia regenti]